MASSSLPSNVVSIGNEIVECARIARLVESYDERFLRRVFTNIEIIICSSRPDVNRAYSEIWAAKEAVAKSIGIRELSTDPSQSTFRFLDIEIRLSQSEKTQVQLYGNAKTSANRLDIDTILVSTSSTRHNATAMAIAVREKA